HWIAHAGDTLHRLRHLVDGASRRTRFAGAKAVGNNDIVAPRGKAAAAAAITECHKRFAVVILTHDIDLRLGGNTEKRWHFGPLQAIYVDLERAGNAARSGQVGQRAFLEFERLIGKRTVATAQHLTGDRFTTARLDNVAIDGDWCNERLYEWLGRCELPGDEINASSKCDAVGVFV